MYVFCRNGLPLFSPVAIPNFLVRQKTSPSPESHSWKCARSLGGRLKRGEDGREEGEEASPFVGPAEKMMALPFEAGVVVAANVFGDEAVFLIKIKWMTRMYVKR